MRRVQLTVNSYKQPCFRNKKQNFRLKPAVSALGVLFSVV